ncbi:hypothetical protein HRbin29_01578 [bacterium HR29]|jgi:bacillithiol system protein YtxJ|nr:hypothetical protein HRbin29_01578 [bacterium HR29]
MFGRSRGRTSTQFVPLARAQELEELFHASHARPVVLFLHDPHCAVSAVARFRLRGVGGEIRVLDVAADDSLKWRIERKTGVRHESPQVLVLSEGRALWHASHGDITAEAVQRALDAAGGAAGSTEAGDAIDR